MGAGSFFMVQPPSGTVTLMFTDIVGSTAVRDALVATLGEEEGDRVYRGRFLEPHNSRMRRLLEQHRGFEVKTNGDSFMVAFERPADAVLCAADFQRSLRDEPVLLDGTRLAVRIGLHTGSATLTERNDYDGHAVNIAARVESLAGGQRIYCSRETATLAKVGAAVRFHSYGAYLLKGVSQPVEIHEVIWDDALPLDPPRQAHERLPYPWLTQWVGRDREMTELEQAMRSSRLVTLHGMGGVGKTRLAVETLLARGGGLPREVVFVPLERAEDSPEGLLTAVREAAGLTEVDAPDFDALRRHFHGGDRLLLLDNFESVMKAAGSVPILALIPGVRVLVTSQQILGELGERVVELEPMASNESSDLFVTLAQQRDRSWQPNDEPAMREVLEATDGLPYLIEIVAVAASKRTLRQLAEELKTRLRDVRSRATRRPERHASVQACLEWALNRLPEEAKTALPRLAIFAGGFDAPAAHDITATSQETLDVLVDAALLRFDRTTGRYSMLRTTQQFMLDVLDPKEHARLNAAHAEWFMARLDKADDALRAKGGEAQRAARNWIHRELANVQQALAWAETTGSRLFMRGVESLGVYLSNSYRFSEKIRLNEALLDRVDRHAAPEAWARTNGNLAIAYSQLPVGDRPQNLRKSIACTEATLQVFTESEFPVEWAMAQNNLGISYRSLPASDGGANLAKAIACYELALRVRTDRDYPIQWAMTQHNLGNAYIDLPSGDREENLRKAIACYRAALRVRTEREFPYAWAMTLNNLATAYVLLDAREHENLEKAITCLNDALRVYTRADFPLDWARTQNNLGNVYAQRAILEPTFDDAQAIACYEAALEVRTPDEFPGEWAETQFNLALLYARRSAGQAGPDRDRAVRCFNAAAHGFDLVGLTEEAADARRRAAALMDDGAST